MEKIEDLLEKGVSNIIPDRQKLKELIASGKRLNIYLGIDPTSPKIHLGHTVALRKLQQFANQGHNATLVIGDFTALIGDTSDKESERPALTLKEIEENLKTYKKQAERIVDFSKIKIRYNSEWLKKLNFEQIIKLCQQFTLGDFISRELIKKRLNDGKKISLQEVLYPVMQGYDSFMLDTDIQLGGTDQTFNIQAGRALIKLWKKKESYVLTMPILEGPDGRKMSKSLGNTIWVEDNPDDIYAKTMAINDNLIIHYYTLVTNLSSEEIRQIENRLKKENNPMKIKKELSFIITKELCGVDNAKKAEENFKKIIQEKKLPDNVEEIKTNKMSVFDFVSNYLNSKSEAKRLISQGGITLNDEKIIDENTQLYNGILKIGKRKIIKIIVK